MSDSVKTIFRTVKRENPYVQIDKTVLNDERLSWKAKGLMAFLLSKPDNWEINVKNLIKQSKDGREAVYSAIKELIKFGYIVCVESRDHGRFSHIEYLIYENPQLANPSNIPSPAPKTRKAKQTPTKTPLPGNPHTVKPYPDFPVTENPPLINNDFRLKNECNNNPPSLSPQKQAREGEAKTDLKILEPVAIKLFGQSNHGILKNLQANIQEFKLDPEVVKECLNLIDAKEIKFNPFGYFRIKYTVAIGMITKRIQVLENQRHMEELIKEKDEFAAVAETETKSVAEIIAEINKTLGITRHVSIKEPAHEPN